MQHIQMVVYESYTVILTYVTKETATHLPELCIDLNIIEINVMLLLAL